MNLRLAQIPFLIFICFANSFAWGDEGSTPEFAIFDYLNSDPPGLMVGYTPLKLDPRVEDNHEKVKSSELRADLKALRPAFDGIVLYGYHHASTPRIVAIAKELKFKAVVLAVWQPKSSDEVDGVAELVDQFHGDFSLAVIVGNEGVSFNRYETDDVQFAADRLRRKIPADVAIGSSTTFAGSKLPFFERFGDFLAPNIHPVFDAPNLPPEKAALWAREEAIKLARKTGKPVILKETGFPHGGKEAYSPESQARFWRAYLKPGLRQKMSERKNHNVYFNVAFEAFDLDWKSEASGLPVEKHWGLFLNNREATPAFEVWKSLVK